MTNPTDLAILDARPLSIEDQYSVAPWIDDDMVFVTPKFKPGEIARAGKEIIRVFPEHITFEQFGAYEKAIEIVENWRSSHSYPMQIIKNNLANRAKKVQPNPIVAQRLKRFISIVSKLKREPHMSLAQMQDIGGCRAIMSSVHHVRELVLAHEEAWDKNPHRHELNKCRDYIATPKASGYRGVHLIYKFISENPKYMVHNGQRIEIQIRSRLQHAWATAVEVVGAFQEQALKSGQGSLEWQRLFALMGSVIAKKEECPLVPDTPDGDSLIQEIRALSSHIKAEEFLAGCSEAAVFIERSKGNAVAYLLILDTNERKVRVLAQDSMRVANEKYAELEKKNRGLPHLQTVLVSVDSLGALKTAYPNYYLDVSGFLRELQAVVSPEFRVVASQQ